MDDSLSARAGQAPFALYGLRHDFVGPRTLAGVGRHGGTVNLVALGHGDRWSDPYVWVQVTVTGPLHGHGPPGAGRGAWSIDPLPMIAVELLNVAGAEFTTTADLERAQQALLSRGFAEDQIQVDGERQSFRVVRQGDHWAALRDIEPDHLLYIVASNVAASDLAVERLHDIRDYRQPPRTAT